MREFDEQRLAWRRENKQALQAEYGLIVDPEIPMLGLVSRLIAEKGVGLLEQILPRLLDEDRVQLVVWGPVEDYRYHESFTKAQDDHPQQVATFFTSDEARPRMVFAGADIILVPSLYEPCGLQQMIAMRYGAIPVVRRTGGLEDTVAPWKPDVSSGNGFLFDSFEPESLLWAIREALALYRRPHRREWQQLQRHNMTVRFSWANSAQQYRELYDQALAASKNRAPLPAGDLVEPDHGEMLVQAILAADELAMTIEQDQDVYLKQVARSARELLHGDAVLIWSRDETAQHRLRLRAYSFARNGTAQQREVEQALYHILPEQGSRSWQYTYRLEADSSIPQSQLGFLDSTLAHKEGWSVQLTVPLNTHGMVLGRIDAFSRRREFTERDKHTLSAFANAVAGNLEKTRLRKQSQRLLAADREMAQAQTLEQIMQIALRYAGEMTHAESGRITLRDEPGHAKTIPTPHRERADLEASSDDAGTSDGAALTRAGHISVIRADLRSAEGQAIGEIEVETVQPAAFSRDDEFALKDLASQVANVLQAAYWREKRDQGRVEQLSKLAASLVGGLDFDPLLEQVVKTTAEVLEARAASLYLINDQTGKLEIRAADGYHRPLLERKASYNVGEGTTGWLAQTGKTFKADSLEELHDKNPLAW